MPKTRHAASLSAANASGRMSSSVSPAVSLSFKIAVCPLSASSSIAAYLLSSTSTLSAILFNFFRLFLLSLPIKKLINPIINSDYVIFVLLSADFARAFSPPKKRGSVRPTSTHFYSLPILQYFLGNSKRFRGVFRKISVFLIPFLTFSLFCFIMTGQSSRRVVRQKCRAVLCGSAVSLLGTAAKTRPRQYFRALFPHSVG